MARAFIQDRNLNIWDCRIPHTPLLLRFSHHASTQENQSLRVSASCLQKNPIILFQEFFFLYINYSISTSTGISTFIVIYCTISPATVYVPFEIGIIEFYILTSHNLSFVRIDIACIIWKKIFLKNIYFDYFCEKK